MEKFQTALAIWEREKLEKGKPVADSTRKQYHWVKKIFDLVLKTVWKNRILQSDKPFTLNSHVLEKIKAWENWFLGSQVKA